jgi:AcrR family transcriptional regulator
VLADFAQLPSNSGRNARFVCNRLGSGHAGAAFSRAMPKEKPDRRIERTRTALRAALVDLVLSEGYENVGVDDVVRRADVGRSTFYMHYRTKDDLLRQILETPSRPFAMIVGQNPKPEALVPMLEHLREQRARNVVFLRPPVRNLWVDCLAQMIAPRVAAMARHAVPVLPLPAIAGHIAETQVALLCRWLSTRPLSKPLAVAEALIAVTHANLAGLLRTPSDSLRIIAD